MDEKKQNPEPISEEEAYEPRPGWQVWGARIALVIFLLFVLWQILGISKGGF